MYRLLVWIVALVAVPAARGQESLAERAWRTLLVRDGVTYKYIYYRKANSRSDGVAMMLENANGFGVGYSFKVVFRSGGEESVIKVAGHLGPQERKAGDSAGLFWVPFNDERRIDSVGLRGYGVTRADTVEANRGGAAKNRSFQDRLVDLDLLRF